MSQSSRNLLALILGGFIGTVLRFEIGECLPYPINGFPWSTLLINWAGCLFLGWFLTITLLHLRIRPEMRLGFGTGLTGAFTTFSTFSQQSVHLYVNGQQVIAMIYVISSAVGGLLLTFAGVALANAQGKKSKGGVTL
jgi:CrcB protein